MPRTASAADILPLTQLPPLSRLLVDLALTLARWDDRRRTRQALSRLDRHAAARHRPRPGIGRHGMRQAVLARLISSCSPEQTGAGQPALFSCPAQ